MTFCYIRRKDDPLKILAWAHTTAPGQVRDFDPDVYEEIEGDLPDGWQPEPKPRTAMVILNELQQLFQAAEVSVQYAFLTPMAGVMAAAQAGNVPLMQFVIQQTEVPEELNSIKQAMLAVFENGGV